MQLKIFSIFLVIFMFASLVVGRDLMEHKTKSIHIVKRSVNWDKSASGRYHHQFEPDEIVTNIRLKVDGYGRRGANLESFIQRSGHFIQTTLVNDAVENTLEGSYKAGEETYKFFLQELRKRKEQYYQNIQSTHDALTVQWNVRGSGNIFDQKGGSINLVAIIDYYVPIKGNIMGTIEDKLNSKLSGLTMNDWGTCFDHTGWCEADSKPIAGFFRNTRHCSGLVCVEAAYTHQIDKPIEKSVDQDWWGCLDSNNKECSCPKDHFLTALWKSPCDKIWCIEMGRCVKYKDTTHGDCYSVKRALSSPGISRCKPGYAISGLYRGSNEDVSELGYSCCKL